MNEERWQDPDWRPYVTGMDADRYDQIADQAYDEKIERRQTEWQKRRKQLCSTLRASTLSS